MPSSKICVSEESVLSNSVWSMLIPMIPKNSEWICSPTSFYIWPIIFLICTENILFLKISFLGPIDSYFFLNSYILLASLRLDSFIMVFLELLFDFNQCQTLTFWLSTFTPFSQKFAKTVPSSWIHSVLSTRIFPDIHAWNSVYYSTIFILA